MQQNGVRNSNYNDEQHVLAMAKDMHHCNILVPKGRDSFSFSVFGSHQL